MRSDLKDLLFKQAHVFSARVREQELLQFESYLELLQQYNQKLNLTGIEDEDGIVIKHFIDSLSGHRFLSDNGTVLDLGSGMGCPGLPLKIARPNMKLILLESNLKKSAFLNKVIRELKLENGRAVPERAEDRNLQKRLLGQFDAALARAFGSLDLILRLAHPYLKTGGRLIAYKGPSAETELKEARRAIDRLGFEHEQNFDYELPHMAGSRTLIMLRKK